MSRGAGMAIAVRTGMRWSFGALVALFVACGGESAPPLGNCVPACGSRICGADGCGGTCGACAPDARCESGICLAVSSCVPSCAGKVCGDDGCGSSCGACASGATCVQGSCHAAQGPGCPHGGTCTYLERTAWRYDCTAADRCSRTAVLATYGTFEACQTWGCMGGNSRCGDQFGNASDPDRWSCEQCKSTCHDGFSTACPAEQETSQGCALSDSIWGAYLADCICQ